MSWVKGFLGGDLEVGWGNERRKVLKLVKTHPKTNYGSDMSMGDIRTSD